MIPLSAIHCRLHVVRRTLAFRRPHEPRLRLRILPQFLQRCLHGAVVDHHILVRVSLFHLL